MRTSVWIVLGAALCAATAWGQANRPGPRIGYLYPAGGQQGAVVQVQVGGQNLRNASDVYVTGSGVRASIVKYVGRFNLDGDQAQELRRRLTALWRQRQAELEGAPEAMPPAAMQDAAMEMVTLPDHPLLANLERKSLRELAYLQSEFKNFRKRQQNAQIAELVLLEIAIDPGAAPGEREIRLRGGAGLTNPMRFQVGTLPEASELELNDPDVDLPLPEMAPIDVPVVLNGQIMPGDVDRFRLRARQGQRLVLAASARSLIPYLADAVPGWFQATLALYDEQGREVAFADDFRFDPDPVLFCEVPKDGIYELEVRDAIYRGREDFVYRVAVGELPFITQVFPLGGPVNTETVASVAGWNLPGTRLALDTRPGMDPVRYAALNGACNRVAYAVDALPECAEVEPNDAAGAAQRVELPRIVNGRIQEPGDVDRFQFEGRAGETVVAEVYGRRLGSPVDSLLRLTDPTGAVLEWNDDRVGQGEGHLYTGAGLLTHHADSYLRVRLPKDGAYCVQVSDTQRHGGDAYAYRLRLGPPQPDFGLRATPSSLSVPVGRSVPVCVYVDRMDGFDGEIELLLADAPAGFSIEGGRIPAGKDRVRVTLTAPAERVEGPVVLRLVGRAAVGGQAVARAVVPAEDMMQAFLYRHLVPSQAMVAAVVGPKRAPRIDLALDGPVRLAEGGTAEVLVRAPNAPVLPDIRLELNEPPKGIALQEVKVVPAGLAFVLKADGEAKAGLVDNLIVTAYMEKDVPVKEGEPAKPKQRTPLGALPAIPIEVVAQ